MRHPMPATAIRAPGPDQSQAGARIHDIAVERVQLVGLANLAALLEASDVAVNVHRDGDALHIWVVHPDDTPIAYLDTVPAAFVYYMKGTP